MDPVVAPTVAAAPVVAPHGNGHGNGSNGAEAESHQSAAALANGPVRTLVLIFKTKTSGLTFHACWQEDDGKTRHPALGKTAHPGGNGHVSTAERAKLIGLAAYARKAHFQYDQDSGVYTVESLVEIPNFLKVVLPAWRRLFAVELDEKAANLLKGTRVIEIEAVAERRSGPGGSGGDAGLNLRWIFRAGERLLTDSEIHTLTQAGRRRHHPAQHRHRGAPARAVRNVPGLAAKRGRDARRRAPLALSRFLPVQRRALEAHAFARDRGVAAAGAGASRCAPRAARAAAALPASRRGVAAPPCEVGCHGLLADEMGLGKTLQVLALLAFAADRRPAGLVVCPASVVPVWREEIAKFFPADRGRRAQDGARFHLAPGTGPLARQLHAAAQAPRAARGVEFGYAVLDEGQFIKNPDAKITQTCFAVRARHRLVLRHAAGKPPARPVVDLPLPAAGAARLALVVRIRAAPTAPARSTRLRAQLAPFILRRTKNEVAQELPPKVEMDLICPLTDVQRAEYARICSEGLERLGDDVGAAMREKSFGFLALLTRLRQTCCDPDMLPWLKAPLTDSGKLNLLWRNSPRSSAAATRS
jgi:hypothetical protein